MVSDTAVVVAAVVEIIVAVVVSVSVLSLCLDNLVVVVLVVGSSVYAVVVVVNLAYKILRRTQYCPLVPTPIPDPHPD